ncbi:transposase [Liquorilactobacillus mali]|uniref:transposase n=1 Tax=Liquorilactobacillus mali TaxID=1618 RepID=UPI00234FCFFE|nr:transposase [Liquorilactobacillus mali]MDC7953323.1 transposase [Liquorilactobacillus mali]
MTKYSSKLKAEVVSVYLNSNLNASEVASKYDLPGRQVRKWIQLYKLGGVETFNRKRHKRYFSSEFKLDVIDYYQTHDDSLAIVVTKYDILAAQISIWRKVFIRDGIMGLRSHPKGRPSKMKRKKKQVRQLEKQSELERLRAELVKKKQELYNTKLENDILKKSMTLFGPSKDVKKHK